MQDFFSWAQQVSGRTAMFNRLMTTAAGVRRCVVTRLDDTVAPHAGDVIVDVGGAHGAVLAGVLAMRPHARGVLFDLPHVVADAQAAHERGEGGATRASLWMRDCWRAAH